VQYAEMMAPSAAEDEHGRRYDRDLWELRTSNRATRVDRARAANLARTLHVIHSEVRHPSCYTRGVTEALAGSRGLPRFADWVGHDHPVLAPARMEKLEVGLVHWRWLLREKTHRARRIHGDLRPEQITFQGDECALLDPAVMRGEPAQDVAAVTLRYAAGALGARATFSGALRDLWDEFWSTYLSVSRDLEILEVIPPFYAREVVELIALNAPEPMAEPLQATLANFAEDMVAGKPFRPDHLDGLLP
jgi:hypothetical protein